MNWNPLQPIMPDDEIEILDPEGVFTFAFVISIHDDYVIARTEDGRLLQCQYVDEEKDN